MTDAPVFILTASRSGSTLLRFILDSHPDLACPPETMVGSACATMIRLFGYLENSGVAERTDVMAPPEVSPEGLKVIREAIDSAYGRYLEQRGKKRWCDKSLDTYQFAELLVKIYPEAKFICLVRHCMDVIVSGARFCPWGVSRYGFDPYVAQFPGNTVAAIGAYWLACNRAILEFRDKNPDRCAVVRYEDLVTAPEDVAADVLAFIGASPAPGITRACFALPHESRGAGDEKIWFTDRVSAGSVGHGVTVPAAALPADMKEGINAILDGLSYRIIDDDWQSMSGTIDPRADVPATQSAAALAGGHAGVTAESVIQALSARLDTGSAAMSQRILAQWPSLDGITVRLVAESPAGGHAAVNWRFPAGDAAAPLPAAAPDDGGTPQLAASPATWLALLDSKANLMDEILTGRLRCFNPYDPHRVRSDEVHAIGALLGLATIPVGSVAVVS